VQRRNWNKSWLKVLECAEVTALLKRLPADTDVALHRCPSVRAHLHTFRLVISYKHTSHEFSWVSLWPGPLVNCKARSIFLQWQTSVYVGELMTWQSKSRYMAMAGRRRPRCNDVRSCSSNGVQEAVQRPPSSYPMLTKTEFVRRSVSKRHCTHGTIFHLNLHSSEKSWVGVGFDVGVDIHNLIIFSSQAVFRFRFFQKPFTLWSCVIFITRRAY